MTKKLKTSVKTIWMVPYYEWNAEKKEREFIGFNHQDYDYYSIEQKYGHEEHKPYQIDNEVTERTLYYHSFYRGRSAAGLVFSDANKSLYIVFLKDFEAFIPHLIKGEIHGNFIFCKRGTNYGTRLVESL